MKLAALGAIDERDRFGVQYDRPTHWWPVMTGGLPAYGWISIEDGINGQIAPRQR